MMKGLDDNEDTCRESEKRIDEPGTPVEVKDQYTDIWETSPILTHTTYNYTIYYKLFISSTFR